MISRGSLVGLCATYDEKTVKTIYLHAIKGELEIRAAKSPTEDSPEKFFVLTVEQLRVIKMEHPKPAQICYGISKHMIGFLSTYLTLEDLYVYESDVKKILLLHSKPEEPVNLFFIFGEELANQIIFKGMSGDIKIWVMNTDSSRYVYLSPGEIQKVRTACQQKVPDGAYLHLGEDGHAQFVGMGDLFVCKYDADKILAGLNEDETKRRVSSYSTHLLKIQDEAIKHFWEKHDPKYPPKSEDVVNWLKEEKGVTQNEAEAIDLIIRSEKAKNGGNKKHKVPAKERLIG